MDKGQGGQVVVSALSRVTGVSLVSRDFVLAGMGEGTTCLCTRVGEEGKERGCGLEPPFINYQTR